MASEPNLVPPSNDSAPLSNPLSGSASTPSLGEVQDGAAAVAGGLGHFAQQVFEVFGDTIGEREIPQVTQRRVQLNDGSGRNRPYYLLQHPNGATVAVFIAAYGQDLYLSWKLFIRPLLNWVTIGLLAAVAFLFGFLPVVGFSTMIAFAGFMAGFLFLAGFTFWIGNLVNRNFFVKELTMFDYEDIRAMSTIAHQALLESADAVGIHIEILQQKEAFYGGRRDRLI